MFSRSRPETAFAVAYVALVLLALALEWGRISRWLLPKDVFFAGLLTSPASLLFQLGVENNPVGEAWVGSLSESRYRLYVGLTCLLAALLNASLFCMVVAGAKRLFPRRGAAQN